MIREGAFARAIRQAGSQGRAPIIADLKASSPKKGDLFRQRSPVRLARELAQAGACALSVVTEGEHFAGSVAVLRAVAEAGDLPVLRKDFFRTVEEVEESRAEGAAAILLILATVPDEVVGVLYERARELGLDAVFEVHTAAELERALAFRPRIIGINNRDIRALETDAGDVEVTEVLAPRVPEDLLVISESSIEHADHVRRARAAGAHAVLVGTALLQADDPAQALRRLWPGEEGRVW